MKEVLVNQIREVNGMSVGYCVRNENVIENLYNIYGEGKVAALLSKIMAENVETYFIDKYCQFIIHFHSSTEYGLSMSFYDYKNNTDIALDEYLRLQNNDWKIEDNERVMLLHSDIVANNKDYANFKLVEPVD